MHGIGKKCSLNMCKTAYLLCAYTFIQGAGGAVVFTDCWLLRGLGANWRERGISDGLQDCVCVRTRARVWMRGRVSDRMRYVMHY